MSQGHQGKRKQLIDAAYRVFVKKGYQNASIKDIAHEAGITPGLVHYYFKNKEELLFSVQDEVQQHYQNQYDKEEIQPTDPTAVLLEIKSRVTSNPDWYRWRYEIYSLGIKSGGSLLEQKTASILMNGRESLSVPLQSMVEDPEKASALAGILLSCFDGLALQKIVDDKFDIDQSYQLLTELLDTYLNNQHSV